MPKVIADKILEPEFVEKDEQFSVGESVWASRYETFLLGEIKQIRYDASLKVSRYRIVTSHSDFWTSKVEKRLTATSTTTTSSGHHSSAAAAHYAGHYGEEGYMHGYDW